MFLEQSEKNNDVHWNSTHSNVCFFLLLQNIVTKLTMHNSLEAYRKSKDLRNGHRFVIQWSSFSFLLCLNFVRNSEGNLQICISFFCYRLPYKNHWFHFKCRIFVWVVLVANRIFFFSISLLWSWRVLPINNNKWFFAFIFNYHRNLESSW